MTESSKNECHILPCNIEYTGTIENHGTHTFFQPQPLTPSHQPGPTQEQTYYASQFRGRGLLAKPVSAQGQVILSTGGHIRTVSTFDRVLEWQHVHQPSAVDSASSRVSKAAEWYEIASTLNAPIHLD